MGKYKRLSGKQIVKALERMGFEQARQRGSHLVMKKLLPEGAIGCVVPMHKEVATGTLHALLKQAHVSLDEFEQNICLLILAVGLPKPGRHRASLHCAFYIKSLLRSCGIIKSPPYSKHVRSQGRHSGRNKEFYVKA